MVDIFLFMDAVGRMVLSICQASALSLEKKSQDVQRSAKGPRWRQEKTKKLVKEREQEQRGGRKVRMLGEERVANRGDSGRANKRSSVTREGAGYFRKGQFREA